LGDAHGCRQRRIRDLNVRIAHPRAEPGNEQRLGQKRGPDCDAQDDRPWAENVVVAGSDIT